MDYNRRFKISNVAFGGQRHFKYISLVTNRQYTNRCCYTPIIFAEVGNVWLMYCERDYFIWDGLPVNLTINQANLGVKVRPEQTDSQTVIEAGGHTRTARQTERQMKRKAGG